MNGGTVLTDDGDIGIHVWFWVRTSLPKRVWKKCMEYEKVGEGGKIVKEHVDERTGVPKKVRKLFQWFYEIALTAYRV